MAVVKASVFVTKLFPRSLWGPFQRAFAPASPVALGCLVLSSSFTFKLTWWHFQRNYLWRRNYQAYLNELLYTVYSITTELLHNLVQPFFLSSSFLTSGSIISGSLDLPSLAFQVTGIVCKAFTINGTPCPWFSKCYKINLFALFSLKQDPFLVRMTGRFGGNEWDGRTDAWLL